MSKILTIPPSSLLELNAAIKSMCLTINKLVDLDFDLGQKAAMLAQLTATRRRFMDARRHFELCVTELSDRYMNLALSYESRPGKAMKETRRLYEQLRAKYMDVAASTNTVAVDVGAWHVPELASKPTPALPKMAEKASSFRTNLSRVVFNTRRHYLPRRHMTVAKAQADYDGLKKVLRDEESKLEARKERGRFLDEQLLLVQGQIAKCRSELAPERGHSVWQASYQRYADIVHELLKHHDLRRLESTADLEEVQESAQVGTQEPRQALASRELNALGAQERLSNSQKCETNK